MDMVGGGPETKAIFHVTRGPASLPSFVNDVAEHFGEFVNEQSAQFAKGTSVPYPMFAPEGGKEALQAEMAAFSMGSDHQVYTNNSFGIPAIYLNDWPDRYIHTNLDVPALEEQIGMSLPADLRCFLRHSDGGSAWFNKDDSDSSFFFSVFAVHDIAARLADRRL